MKIHEHWETDWNAVRVQKDPQRGADAGARKCAGQRLGLFVTKRLPVFIARSRQDQSG